jgi:hypothetical protein
MSIDEVKSCNYCQSSIGPGQRWVREKIYDPNRQDPAYRHFHAESCDGEGGSCWEKYQTEREIARTAVIAETARRLQVMRPLA